MDNCICNRDLRPEELHSPACTFQQAKEPEDKRKLQGSFYRYQDTPASSIIGHLMILASEMKDRAKKAEDNNEKFWYYDATTLVTEVLIRLDQYRIEEELNAEGDRHVRRKFPSNR